MRGWAWGDGYELLTGDVNGDGRQDVVAVDNTAGQAFVALSNGVWFDPSSHLWVSGWGSGDFEMHLADVTGDGRDDLIARARQSGDWYVAWSNGSWFMPSHHVWMRGWAAGSARTQLAGDVTG
jgi:hypothetical protein